MHINQGATLGDNSLSIRVSRGGITRGPHDISTLKKIFNILVPHENMMYLDQGDSTPLLAPEATSILTWGETSRPHLTN